VQNRPLPGLALKEHLLINAALAVASVATCSQFSSSEPANGYPLGPCRRVNLQDGHLHDSSEAIALISWVGNLGSGGLGHHINPLLWINDPQFSHMTLRLETATLVIKGTHHEGRKLWFHLVPLKVIHANALKKTFVFWINSTRDLQPLYGCKWLQLN